MKTILLNFIGYFTNDIREMLEGSGIYCVYRGVDLGKTVMLNKLIYIGESQNVRDRISQHISDEDWVECLNRGECFCYSNAPVNSQDRERVEAALIYKYKPQYNTQHKYNFGDYAGTKIITTGSNKWIENTFTVDA